MDHRATQAKSRPAGHGVFLRGEDAGCRGQGQDTLLFMWRNDTDYKVGPKIGLLKSALIVNEVGDTHLSVNSDLSSSRILQ